MWRESNEELKEIQNSEFRKIVDFSNPCDNKSHCERSEAIQKVNTG